MMTELERLRRAIERQYSRRPKAGIRPLFIGSSDYQDFDAWTGELEALRRELIDLCEGRIDCNHPVGAIVQHPETREYYCELCGKDLKK